MMLLGAGGDDLPIINNIQASNLSLDVQSFNAASSSSGSSTVVNLAPNGSTNGTWTTDQSNNPSAGTASMTTVTRNNKSIPAWDFNGGFNPSSGWIHFNGNSTDFPGGSASFSCMWWVAHDNAAADWGLGGQDGSPTWTNTNNINNATAAINSKRGGQHEFLGHGFDQRAGGGEGAPSNDEWVCLVYVVSGTEFKIYRNGMLLGSTTYSGKNTANTNFFIGRSWSKEDLEGVDGKIAWTAYWKNTLLTQSEITQIWNQTYEYFGVGHSTLRMNFPASGNWIGINNLTVVVNGQAVQGTLNYNTSNVPTGFTDTNQLTSDSGYNPAADPRGSWHWSPNQSSGFAISMRFPVGTIESVSDIDYIQISYHVSYVNVASNMVLELNGEQVSYTRTNQGTANDGNIERYTPN